MTQLNAIRELQPQTFEQAMPHPRETGDSMDWLASIFTQRDLLVVIGFCAIGLVLTLVAVTHLQGFADAIADISLVP